MAAGDHHQQAAAGPPVVALSSGKAMPRVGLGTASFPLGEAGGDTDRRPLARDAVLRALSAGYRHVDTAAVYGTEAAVGDAVAEAVRAGTVASRDEVYVTSKLWIADAHPARVLPALERTLGNLQMEHVDLYLVHFPVSMKLDDEQVLVKESLVALDMEGVWAEMEECHRRGLARAIGVSNFSCRKLEHLLSFAKIPPAVNQVEVHPYCRQTKLRAFCRSKGIQLCGYSPLGGKGAPWANSCVMDSPVLRQIAQDRGKSLAQVCIRWVYEQGDCVVAKSFNEERMRENLRIFDWELTDDDRRKISALPESRGTYDFFVHESGPYKTAQEFWDGEIVAGQTNLSALE